MDEQFYIEKLKTIRKLTRIADPFIKRPLIQLAIRYEKELITAKAKEEEQGDDKNTDSCANATQAYLRPTIT